MNHFQLFLIIIDSFDFSKNKINNSTSKFYNPFIYFKLPNGIVQYVQAKDLILFISFPSTIFNIEPHLSLHI